MKRPLAYVTAAWRGGECEVMEQAAKYCRIVYDAGYFLIILKSPQKSGRP